MARRLTEEQITKSILIWLEATGWKVVCFDFPQSGTGVILHPNSDVRESTKNKDSIIPDIVAVKENIAIFFENKDRFVFKDIKKINELRINNLYSFAINTLLKDYEISTIFYGIGLPYNNSCVKKIDEHFQMIDFAVFVQELGQIKIGFQIESIF